MISIWHVMFIGTLLFGYLDIISTIISMEFLVGFKELNTWLSKILSSRFHYFGYVLMLFLKLIVIIVPYILTIYVHELFGIFMAFNFSLHLLVIYNNFVQIVYHYADKHSNDHFWNGVKYGINKRRTNIITRSYTLNHK